MVNAETAAKYRLTFTLLICYYKEVGKFSRPLSKLSNRFKIISFDEFPE